MSIDFATNGCYEWGAATALPLSNGATLSGWVKFAAASGTDDVVFFAQWDAAAGVDPRLILNRSGGTVYAVLDDPAGYAFVGTITPTTGTWYHFALVFTGTALDVYINGAFAYTTAATTSAGAATLSYIRIGSPAAAGVEAKETIQDVVLYTAALTAGQIAGLAAQRLPTVAANLAAQYPLFPSGIGTSLNDYSGNARTLASVGTAVANGSNEPAVPWAFVSANGLARASGDAAVSGSGAPAASGLARATGAASTTGAASPAASGLSRASGVAAAAGSAAPAASGLARTTGTAVLGGAAAPAASGLSQATGTAAVVAAGQIDGGGLARTTGVVAISATALPAASGLARATGTADVGITYAISAIGLARATGIAVVSGGPPGPSLVGKRSGFTRRNGAASRRGVG